MSESATSSAPVSTREDSPTRRPIPWFKWFSDWIMVVIVLGMMAYFSITTDSFLTSGNLSSLLTQNAATFVVAAIAGMLLMAGYVDLSIGSGMALSGVAAGLVFNSSGTTAGLLTGLGVGLAIGLFNGVLIGFFELSPIVVTLGGLAGARALAQYLSPDQIYGFPPAVGRFAVDELLGITHAAWVAVAVAVVSLVAMGFFPFGRKVQAIGVNHRAAFLVGLRVKPTVVWLYVLTGLAVGVAGLIQIARLDSAPSGTLGVGFEVTVLTAILLGGIPFTGGRGSLWRVLLGVWLLAVLRNGLTLLNYGPEMAGMVTGGVLIFAAGLQAMTVYFKRRA